MNILKEAKDKLPIPLLTDLVSKGWVEVGTLKQYKEEIKKEFKDTKKIEELLQGLIDSYLIFIGQTEMLLEDKKYIELPKEPNEKEDKKELSEDLLIKVTPLVDVEPIINSEDVKTATACNSCEADLDDNDINDCDTYSDEFNSQDTAAINEPFDYFCDFDEPNLAEPKLTDKDIYNC